MLAAFCVAALAAGAVGPRSMERKLDAIESGKLRPGASVLFTPGEIHDWLKDHATVLASYGVRNLRVALGTGRVTAYAQIDFLKLKQTATGEAPGWIGKELLAGERPVSVTVRVQSRAGRARVDVERVEISGVPVEGAALDFLIRAYLIPAWPEAKVDEWFRLNPRVDRIAVAPDGVSVHAGYRSF